MRRLDAFESLKARAALYRDGLQAHVTDLQATLADLAQSVERLLETKCAA